MKFKFKQMIENTKINLQDGKKRLEVWEAVFFLLIIKNMSLKIYFQKTFMTMVMPYTCHGFHLNWQRLEKP